jgi:hypothetical protein
MNEEVELGPGLGRPEETLLTLDTEFLHNVFQHETLPRCSDLRVALEISTRLDVQEIVQ